MSIYKRIAILFLVGFCVVITTAISALRNSTSHAPAYRQKTVASRETPQTESNNQIPTVDYDAPESADPEKRLQRRARNARYDNDVFVRKDDATGKAVKTTFFNDWEVGLPALPVTQSEIVFTGEVTDARASL